MLYEVITTMTLENSRGQKRVRTIEGWEREISDMEEQECESGERASHSAQCRSYNFV